VAEEPNTAPRAPDETDPLSPQPSESDREPEPLDPVPEDAKPTGANEDDERENDRP
jgi:hypothetical protein